MPVFTPWPREAFYPWRRIKKYQEHNCDMVTICIDDGPRYREVIEALVPLIEERALKISKCANEIIDMLPEREGAGRYPKWFKIIERVEDTASTIANIVDEDLRPLARTGGGVEIVEVALRQIRKLSKEIEQNLKQIPRPIKPADLTVWEEALAEAFED